MRSLWYRLIAAFAVVILVALGMVIAGTTLATARQYDLLIVRSGQAWTRRLAPLLADSYIRNGSWRDAQAILEGPLADDDFASGGRQQRGPGGLMGPGMMAGQGFAPDMMGFDLLLADAQGIVVADTGGERLGDALPPALLGQGTPVLVGGRPVGTLLVVSPEGSSPARRAFLLSVGRAALTAGLAAGLLALVMGTLLFQGITRPLRHLQAAAQQVAAGDLQARVPVESRDELGDVAAAFNRMSERLADQQRLRQQMVADIAHELRNPISIMQGTLEAIADGLVQPTPDEIRDLHGDVRRLARLVEDLRTLSLADAGQLTLVRGPIDPAELAEGAVSRWEGLATERGVSLRAAVEPGLPALSADEDRLAQVLGNLLDNALRHTPAGGQVMLRARRDGSAVLLEVSDSGPGIAPDDLPYVFERFWRGDRSRSRQSGGSGLGLAIARQLVEMHGGTLTVESQPGAGSTFRARLPAA